jgi:hypothetical protein
LLLAVQPKSFPYQLQKLNALGGRYEILVALNRPEEARQTLRQWVELSDAIVAASPTMSFVRFRFVMQRSVDLVHQVQEGQTADLDRRAAEVLALVPATRDPDPARNVLADSVRYNVACAFAQAAKVGEPDRREKAATRAVAELETLARLGYFALPGRMPHLESDPDLDPLRDRADFKQFVALLKAPREVAPPPRAVISP